MILGRKNRQKQDDKGSIDAVIQNMTRRTSGEETGQIQLGLKKSRLEFLYKLKARFAKMTILMEALPFWRNFNTIIALVSSLTFVGAMFYVISKNYLVLPGNIRIPLVYLQSSRSWELLDKEVLILIPVVAGAMLVLLINFSSTIYRFDRRLSYMMNIGIILFNILGSIAFFQLLSF